MNKINLKNPCLDCDLLNEDKNNQECKNCARRVAYVEAIGGMVGSLPGDVSMDGNSGYSVEDFISYREPEGGRVTMSKREEVEILIEDICEDNLVTAEAMRGGGRSLPIAKARRLIIERLVSPDFKMEQADIAKLVGVTYAAVNLIVGKMRKEKGAEIESKIPPSGSILAIVLDFSGLEDVYEWLDESSRAQLRTRENLALFILKEKHDAVLGDG